MIELHSLYMQDLVYVSMKEERVILEGGGEHIHVFR